MKRYFLTVIGVVLTVSFFTILFFSANTELSAIRREQAKTAFQKVTLVNSLLEQGNSGGASFVVEMQNHIALIGETIIVCDRAEVVIASTNSELIGKKYSELGLTVFKDSSKPDTFVNKALYLQPTIRHNAFIGYVGLIQDFRSAGALAVTDSRWLLLLTLIILVFVLSFCYWSATRIIFKPVERLQKVVSECGLSDPLLNPEAPASNELSMLGRAIGQMNCQLKADRDYQQQQLEALTASNRELEQAKRDLSSAERVALAGRLASSIAHDVGNPLGVVQGYLTMLDSLDNDQQTQVIAKMQRELDRITRAIHSLLDVSRPIVLERHSIEIGPWLTDLVERIRQMSRMARVDVSLDNLLPQGYKFSIDEERLTAVMENLLINGADAMANNPAELPKKLSITAQEEHGGLKMTVDDNGPGIVSDMLEQVFEPFFSTKPSQRGTGLGLYTAKQVVELHNGEITLINKKNGGLIVAVLLLPC